MRLLDEFGRFTEFVRTRLDELARLLYVLTAFFNFAIRLLSSDLFSPMVRLGFHDFQTMLRAVPMTVRTAESRLVVLRSTSLIFAISITVFGDFADLVRFGSAEPLRYLPHAVEERTPAVVFKINVKRGG